MFPTCKDLFNTTSSSDDNSFYGFSKEELKHGLQIERYQESTIVNSNICCHKHRYKFIMHYHVNGRSRLCMLKLAESGSDPLMVLQNSSGFHLIDSSF